MGWVPQTPLRATVTKHQQLLEVLHQHGPFFFPSPPRDPGTKPPLLPEHLGPTFRSHLTPANPPRGDSCVLSLLCLSLPGGLQLPHRKHALLHNSVGKLRHKAMMAMPSLQWADLVWHYLPPPLPFPGHHPLPHQDIHPPAQRHAPAVWESGCGDPWSLHNRIWGSLARGKTAVVAAEPSQGSLLLPGARRWG